jgi:hypothetical protein
MSKRSLFLLIITLLFLVPIFAWSTVYYTAIDVTAKRPNSELIWINCLIKIILLYALLTDIPVKTFEHVHILNLWPFLPNKNKVPSMYCTACYLEDFLYFHNNWLWTLVLYCNHLMLYPALFLQWYPSLMDTFPLHAVFVYNSSAQCVAYSSLPISLTYYLKG